MLEKVRHFLDEDVPYFRSALGLLLSASKDDSEDVRLMRHLLGSIDLKDVKPVSMLKEGERKDFVASIAIVFPKILRILSPLIDEQKDAGYTLEGDPMFTKGTMNGLYLALEAFETLRAEHMENTKPRENFDTHSTLPELLERFSRPSGRPATTNEERSN